MEPSTPSAGPAARGAGHAGSGRGVAERMDALNAKGTHGFDPVRGYRVFVPSALVPGP
ncbi:hypothetical protein RB200_34995 [Streptomyces sp. PmtG]